MRKRIYHFLFITIFFICIIMPFLHTEWIDGGISLDENRSLSDLPALFTDNKFNENFTTEFEDWFMDHLGYRNELISLNATIQSNLFDRLLTQSNYHIGPQGDINYATTPNAGNNDKLLLVCDSYIKSYIVDDLAESFAEVWLIWNDYTTKIPEIIEMYQPNLVIYECAERVDKSHDITILAQYKISAQ